MKILKNRNGTIYVEVQTANGVLSIYDTPNKNHVGINIRFRPDNGNGMDIPLVCVANGSQDANNVKIYVWGNPWNEDYSKRTDVPVNEIAEALLSEE